MSEFPEKLTGHVPIRFPESTIATVKALADQDGMTVSGWIRQRVREELNRRVVWSECEHCGRNIFRHYTWSHEGGTPPQDHEAEPSS
jgi:hypothetical protein